MKKYIYSVLVASCAMFASCSQDGEVASPTVNPQVNYITEISASAGVESRAVVSAADNTKINWEEGDALKVFGNSTSVDYTLSAGTGSTTGTFTNASSTLSTIEACMYPTQSTATWSDSKLTCNIPTVQTATAGSFDKNAAIMYYIGNNLAVTLKSAVAFLKVTIDNTNEIDQNVHAITISSASSYLSGNIEISSTGVATPTDASGSVKSVTLVASETNPSAVLANGTYYIAVMPGTIENPSISYTYINTGSTNYTSYNNTTTTHFATVKSKTSSNNLSVNAADVQPIKISSWTGATEKTAVQLWENGPYFAEYNIGATNEYTIGTSQKWGITGTVTAENDLLPARYDNATQTWSSAWRVPTKTELDGIVGKADASNKKVKSYTYGTHRSQTSNYGWNVSGANNYGSLFFPANSNELCSEFSGHANYWSSTANGSNAWNLYLSYDIESDGSNLYSDPQYAGNFVRPVLR